VSRSVFFTTIIILGCVQPVVKYLVCTDVRRAYCESPVENHDQTKSVIQCHHQSENPTSLPFQLHQIISSSSTSPTFHLSPSASPSPFRHVIHTPSTLALWPLRFFSRAVPHLGCWDSSRNSSRVLSIDADRFCRGIHAGCWNRRGTRKRTCVCVGAMK